MLGHFQPANRVIAPVAQPTLRPFYASACAYFGVLIFADVADHAGLRDAVIEAYEPYRTGKKTPLMGHVDNNLFGIVPLELYRQTSVGEYLAMGRVLADEEWINPREDGLTRYTRWWLDDPLMVGNLQAQAYKNTKDVKYVDRGVQFQLSYFTRLRRENGLFHHRVPEWRVSWSRDHGWATMAMAEMLLAMPSDHALRENLMQEYLITMKTLSKYQHDGGMWGEYIDVRNARPESSRTGMIIFALANGVCEGWLRKKPFRKVAECAWLSLTDYVDGQGAVGNVSEMSPDGIPKPFMAVGDMHGQAAVLWAATAMIRVNGKSRVK